MPSYQKHLYFIRQTLYTVFSNIRHSFTIQYTQQKHKDLFYMHREQFFYDLYTVCKIIYNDTRIMT